MRKIFAFSIVFLLFFGCKNTISYKLINKTNYDAILIDNSSVDKPEYYLKANSSKTIEHYDSGHFELKDNIYPIEVFNGFSSTSINNMPTYELLICNNTNMQFELHIINSIHSSTNTFIITPFFNQNITIYLKGSPSIELLYNNSIYHNFVLNDCSLIMF